MKYTLKKFVEGDELTELDRYVTTTDKKGACAHWFLVRVPEAPVIESAMTVVSASKDGVDVPVDTISKDAPNGEPAAQ